MRLVLTDVDVEVDIAELEVDTARLPMVDNVVHIDDGGAGCAAGVDGSPWWNVDVPYTPMGYKTESRRYKHRTGSA